MSRLILLALLACVGCAQAEVAGSSGSAETSSAGATSTTAGSTGSTTAGSTAAGASSSSAGATSAGTSTGTAASSSSTSGGGTTGGDVGTGTSGGGTTTGGSSTGGSTTGGGAFTLAEACTDYVAGREAVATCEGLPYGGPTQSDCETLLVVCTADDNVVIDGIGTCLAGLECDPIFIDYENAVLACFGLASGLSEPCLEAGTPSIGDGG